MTIRSAMICLSLLAAVPALAAPAGPDEGFLKFLQASEESTQGNCSATCGDMGGTVSVQCQGTCTIQDQDCDSGVRGHVQCQTTGARADCPVCEWCTAEGSCPEGGYIGCGTWGYDWDSTYGCDGGDGLCYVRCDGQWQWCPGHVGQILCSW